MLWAGPCALMRVGENVSILKEKWMDSPFIEHLPCVRDIAGTPCAWLFVPGHLQVRSGEGDTGRQAE